MPNNYRRDVHANENADGHPTDDGQSQGFLQTEPMPLKRRKSSRTSTVVRLVMMIGLSRHTPAIWTASSTSWPATHVWLMVLIFRIELLIIIPDMTMVPMADIMFRVSPKNQSIRKALAMSIESSTSKIRGYRKVSNRVARMTYSKNTEISRTSIGTLMRVL